MQNNIHTAAKWWPFGGLDTPSLIFSSSYPTSSSVSESDSLTRLQSSSLSASSPFYHTRINSSILELLNSELFSLGRRILLLF